MPQFSYVAHTMDGTLRRGSIEAQDTETAREQLRKQQLLVEELHQSTMAEAAAPAMPVDSPLLQPEKSKPEALGSYVPLLDTLRLYAGWLLAWYGLVYLLGSYQYTKHLPFEVPFIEGLFLSPLVLEFAFATFLFLLLSTLHRWTGGGVWKGLIVAAAGILLFTMFLVNS
jgi:hypothetical protein